MKKTFACFIALAGLAVGDVKAADAWDTFSDTWVGEDALGRARAAGKAVGLP